MYAAVSSRFNLDSLLRGFLAGDPATRETLPRVSERYVLKIVRRYAADLPEDIHREVMNQAFTNLLLETPASYNPARGSAGTFLKLIVRNAAREVRALYTPPGQVTRPNRTKKLWTEPSAPLIIAMDDLAQTDVPCTDTAMAEVEARHDVEALLRRAAPWLATSLKRLYFDDVPMETVASEAGMSRFTLSRRIQAFATEVAATA
jgi:hypothetical protein